MCNVPPKFYQVCRLCLSYPKQQRNDNNNGDDHQDGDGDNNSGSFNDVSLSIFDKKTVDRNIPRKIMTCLSILVGDS